MATRRTTGSARTIQPTPAATDKAAPQRRDILKGTESSTSPDANLSADARRRMIEQSAYLRAERRGFTAGGEVEDWLLAEAEVDALLRAGNGRPPQ